ncbi:hypothetical protein [Methylocystis echinoides]|uniref:Uncharacterized protein n=1 Tax=Methylocystis echinoides TaxID=29468 RepID=A0A9W6GX64_9HYPH|nr:hypothetical protein [Methylocystis echinoides]GLI94751.1 hypothetical protein LMG27198_37430 [Methylocystis echinoides]
MTPRLLTSIGLTLLTCPAWAAPALYNCVFEAGPEKEAQVRHKPHVVDYIYDPVAGGGVILGNDLEVLVVKGAEAISFVTKGPDGGVDSTTIHLNGQKDNRFPAVFSSHHIEGDLRPGQWRGWCTLSQRG